MAGYIARRIVQLIPVLIGVYTLVFLGIHVIPGDAAQVLMGERGTVAQLQRLRHQLGLDQPVYVQYGRFFFSAVRGDFGVSLRTERPVMRAIGEALPVTAQLTISALALALCAGLAIGLLSARRPHSPLDMGMMVGVLVGISMPVFWTGILLLQIFGGRLGWLPLGGMLDEGMSYRSITGAPLVDGLLTASRVTVLSSLRHLVLPAVTLSLTSIASIARMARSSLLEALDLDFVRTARAKGVPERTVMSHHALRNALLTIVTLVGLQLGLLLSGAVAAEMIFALPGLGRLAITSILDRDYPTVQGVVIVAATIFVVVNLLVDVTYAYLDPRIRYTS
jgi:peptide/nickel transport system permease protein